MSRVLAIALVLAGCWLPGHGGAPASSSNGTGIFEAIFGGGGRHYCTIRPQLYASWTEPMDVPASCRSEGWVRQLIRDAPGLEVCRDPDQPEIRVLLEIDVHGRVTRVVGAPPTTERTRGCVEAIVTRWELAPSPLPGEIVLVYRTGGVSPAGLPPATRS